MKKVFIFVISGSIFFTFLSCKKEASIQPASQVGELIDTTGPLGKLEVKMNAFSNELALVPVTKTYTNSSSDLFTVSKFNYYISNIKLTRSDGFIFSEADSYHLIKHVEGKTSFTVSNLPSGNYTEIEFLIGVDSIRNISGVQSGDLDVANNMFWDWNTGYIFFKMEGSYISNQTPSPGGDYAIHVGGFEGEFNCLQKVKFLLSSPVVAQKKKQSALTYRVILDEVFSNPQEIGFDHYYENVIKGPKIFQDISFNYRNMFKVDKVEN